MLHLTFYLKSLAEQEDRLGRDVRAHNREAFGLHKLLDADLEELLNSQQSPNEKVVFNKRYSQSTPSE